MPYGVQNQYVVPEPLPLPTITNEPQGPAPTLPELSDDVDMSQKDLGLIVEKSNSNQISALQQKSTECALKPPIMSSLFVNDEEDQPAMRSNAKTAAEILGRDWSTAEDT